MVDWDLAIGIFFTGVLGVMVVMFFLQITIQATSAIVKIIEKPKEKAKAES